MSKRCEITGRTTSFGRNVSFSKRRTSRTYKPNVHTHRVWVPEEGRYVRMQISAKGLRTISKRGGLIPTLKAEGKSIRKSSQR